MASVFTAPLWDRGCNIKGLQCAALPIIFQFKHCLTAVVSRLIYTVAFVEDRDHYGVNTERKHIRAWPGNGREGDAAEEQPGAGRVSLGNEGAMGGEVPPDTAPCHQAVAQWHSCQHLRLHYVALRCCFSTFSLDVAVKAIPLCTRAEIILFYIDFPFSLIIFSLLYLVGWAWLLIVWTAASRGLPWNCIHCFGQTVQQGNKNHLLFICFTCSPASAIHNLIISF